MDLNSPVCSQNRRREQYSDVTLALYFLSPKSQNWLQECGRETQEFAVGRNQQRAIQEDFDSDPSYSTVKYYYSLMAVILSFSENKQTGFYMINTKQKASLF